MPIDLNKFFKGFIHAFHGFLSAIQTEQNLRFQLLAVVPVIILCFYLKISEVSFILVIVSIFLVISAELFNTAIENLCDFVSKKRYNEQIRKIKDISAGAVCLTALNALIIGIIILLIPLIKKIAALPGH